MVTEKTQVADSALPVPQLKDHLRLASGFDTDQVQDPLLIGFLRAALAQIEARTGKALLRRMFEWQPSPALARRPTEVPIGPVVDIAQVRDAQGTVLDSAAWQLSQDGAVTRFCATVPNGAEGPLTVEIEAGFGASFDALPPDLAQAVMLLAAHYYEFRHETALGAGCMPFGVTALIERYRPIRISMGASA